MNKITTSQIAKIHVLLNQLQLIDEKANFVSQFSKGRTTSCKGLSMNEAKDFISYLSAHDPSEKMRKKVIALAYEAGIITGHSDDDRKINQYVLKTFLLERGTVKKELNRMDKPELIKTINQFEQIVKHNRNAVEWQSTKAILNDIGINTSK